MSWQSDWLYQLVFKEYRKAWDKAQREGEGAYGPASTIMVVGEYSDADRERPGSRGERIRAWKFAGDNFTLLSAVEWEELGSEEITGMFYTTAAAAFHIAPDRKRVVIEYWFGPRYGRGFQYGVVGQGETGRLVGMENARCWVS